MVEAVIVSHNSCHILKECVTAALAQTIPFSKIYVLENGDCSGECLGDIINQCFFQVLPENNGFGAAVNFALSRSTSDFVVTLNPDVTLSNDWVEKTIRIAESTPKAAAVSSIAFSSLEGVIDGFGDVVSWPGFHWRRSHGAPRFIEKLLPSLRKTDSVCAGYALYRTEALRSVGGFFEPLFLYSEDVELALRLQSEGWIALVTQETCAIHLGGKSSGRFDLGIRKIKLRNLTFVSYITGGGLRRRLLRLVFGSRLHLNELLDSDHSKELIQNYYSRPLNLKIRGRMPWRLVPGRRN